MHKGFTIIELAVTMFIIALLSSVLFMSTRDYEARSLLKRTAQQMAQDLREIQQMAMGAVVMNCNSGDGVRIFGTYMEEDDSSYILFVDCNGDDTYSTGGPPASRDVIMRTVQFDSGVKICSISSPPPAAKLSVVFKPPNPDTVIDGNLTNKSGIIELCLVADPTINQFVGINTAGRIEIQ